MSEITETSISCPCCGAFMIKGFLKTAMGLVYAESLQSLSASRLEALICPECGHVDLRAASPEELAHHDITDEDLAACA